MSEPTKIDRDLLSQARHIVGGFLEELRALAQQPDVAPADFFGQLLQGLTGLLCSAAGAVWSRPEDGRWRLEAQHELRRIPQFSAPDHAADHARLLQAVAAQEKPMLLAPGASVRRVEQARNSSDYLLVLAPLRSHKGVVGLIELFQVAGKPAALQRSYLSLASQVCQIAQDYLKDRSLRRVDKRQSWWAELDRFRCSAHASLRLTDTAYTLANEGRRLLDCDRLSVVAAQSGKCHVAAISGQDAFDPRSSAVRRLAQLATAVVRSGTALWYAGDRSGLPPQIEQILDDYLEESHARMVGVIPLSGVHRPEGAPPNDELPAKPTPVGALVIERFRDVPPSDESCQRVEEVQRVSALALANAIAYDGHLLAPLSRVLSQIGVLRHKPWTKIALAAAAAVILCLALIPANLQLEGRGTLEPVGRRDVFAATDGVVREVKVQHGSVVTRGQVLVVLTNSDVEVKLAELQGQQAATKQQLEAAQHTLLAGQLSPADRDKLHGERAELMETLASLKTQLELYQRKAEQLLIRAPVDGQVVTWDVDNLLKSRPVERGQMLLSMADVDGPWELEVRMPEDRLGHIAQAQAVLGETLPVTYILATEPGVTSQGSVQEVHQRAELRGNEGNTVLLRVAIDRRQHAQLRRGATVVAKVHCGRRALAYAWFHDLWEFVQSRILFRL